MNRQPKGISPYLQQKLIISLVIFLIIIPILDVPFHLLYKLYEESDPIRYRLHSFLFFLSVSYLTWIYVKLIKSDPGYVPKRSQSSILIRDESNDESLYPEKEFCGRCFIFKPERAHHCRICNRCILRMDHHCPWIGNCIGVNNHKYFIQFLYLVCANVLYFLILILMRCKSIYDHSKTDNQLYEIIFLGFLLVIYLLAFFFAGIMLFSQLYLIGTNQTQIEYRQTILEYSTFIQESSNNPDSIPPIQQKIYSPFGIIFNRYGKYNIGWKDNFYQVCGDHCLLWCLPIPERKKESLDFPLNPLYISDVERQQEVSI